MRLTGLVLCLVAGCAAPATTSPGADESTTAVASEPRPPAEGERLVFSEDSVAEPVQNWLIYEGVLLPDGTIAVSYDLDTAQAGEDSGQPREPRVALLSDGSLDSLELPVVVEGVQADLVSPRTSSPAGDLLCLDSPARRLLELSAAGEWSVRAEPPPTSALGGSPVPAYGPSGTLYVAVGGSVYAYPPGESAQLIAGIPVEEQGPDEPQLGEFPRPATSQPLPLVRSMVVGDDGTVYLGFQHTLLALSDGQLTVFADERTPSQDGGDNLIVVPTWREDGTFRGTFLTSLALDADKAVLVSDSGHQRILRIARGKAEVLIDDASSLSNGSRVSDTGQDILLFFRGGGDSLCEARR